MLRMGGPPMSLLYSNLDLKEASQITSALDGAGVKYEIKGDGSTIMVDRDKVASARLMLSGKGLPTSGSVGYEIFDSAPALGQTDFMQTSTPSGQPRASWPARYVPYKAFSPPEFC